MRAFRSIVPYTNISISIKHQYFTGVLQIHGIVIVAICFVHKPRILRITFIFNQKDTKYNFLKALYRTYGNFHFWEKVLVSRYMYLKPAKPLKVIAA